MMPTEWSYAGHVDKTGAVLYDIKHDDEKFLKKVSLIKSYAEIDFRDGKPFHLHPFDLGDLATDRLVPQRGGKFTKHSKDFLHLNNREGRSPDYYYKRSHLADMKFFDNDLGGSGQNLGGHQTYQFTETSNSPRHETGGIAAAGRFYPTIEFSVDSFRKQRHQGAIKALRFDFWLEPDLREGGRRQASTHIPIVEQLVGGIDELLFTWNPEESPPQQAGLFRDRNQGLVDRVLRAKGFGIGKPGAQIFSHAEKPIIWEIVADGIKAGDTTGTWDNIHIWSYSSEGLVSTPGMPFGIHMHWRWAATATDPLSMVLGRWTPKGWKAPELAGRSITGKKIPGGPLIDPRSPKTDLRLAWVKKSTAEQYSQKTASYPEEFEALFSDNKTNPENVRDSIDDGDKEQMVLLVSIVVYRKDVHRTWKGSVFSHGMFFPHSHDLGYVVESAFTMAGAYDKQYLKKQPKKATWKRNPK